MDFFTADDLDQQKVTANLDVFTRTKQGKGLRRKDANQATMSMGLLAASALSGGDLHVAVQPQRFPWWFLVAYPDVVTWLRLKTQSQLEQMAGTNDLMSRTPKGNLIFSLRSLRCFIDAFKQELGTLETARPANARPAPPTDLHDFVTVVSVRVFKYAVEGVRTLIEEGGCQDVLGTDPNTLNATGHKILLEWVALSLHLVDRIAGRLLDPEKRSQFMDELVTHVSETLARVILTDKYRRGFKDYFVSIYQERSQSYAPLSLPSLSWQASGSIANAYFPKSGPASRLSIEFLLLYTKLNKLCTPAFTAAGSPQQRT